jgi:hypothetical protein
MLPFKRNIDIDSIPYHGRFGAIRKHDIHTGLDLYCEDDEPFHCVEDGIIINIFGFTGESVGSHWWNNTKAILVRCGKYHLLYGEVDTNLKIGDEVKEGDELGIVKRVLKEDKGLPMIMLHIEAYDLDYNGEGEIWYLESVKPKNLLNIEHILFN